MCGKIWPPWIIPYLLCWDRPAVARLCACFFGFFFFYIIHKLSLFIISIILVRTLQVPFGKKIYKVTCHGYLKNHYSLETHRGKQSTKVPVMSFVSVSHQYCIKRITKKNMKKDNFNLKINIFRNFKKYSLCFVMRNSES